MSSEKKQVTYNSPYTSIGQNIPFEIELLNEINLMRDKPKFYKSNLDKFKKEKDEKNNSISILLKEGKVTYSLKEFNEAMLFLENSRVKNLITIDTNLSKICEKIYKEKIKQLKSFTSLDSTVYKFIDSYIKDVGNCGGKVSFLIDIENKFTKHILINNLVTGKAFMNDKHKLIGVYQENNITVLLLTRYFVLNGMSADYVSDSNVEKIDEIKEDITYEKIELNDNKDILIKDEEWSKNISKIEKSVKILNDNGKYFKQIRTKKYFEDGNFTEDLVEKIVLEDEIKKELINNQDSLLEKNNENNFSSGNEKIKKNVKMDETKSPLKDKKSLKKSDDNQSKKESANNKSITSGNDMRSVASKTKSNKSSKKLQEVGFVSSLSKK